MKKSSTWLRSIVEGGAGRMQIARFAWKDQYSLGIEAMDGEHKILIEKINNLATGLEDGVKKSEMEDLFADLANYCIEHFSDEERFLESIAYPDLKNHKLIHKKLLSRVAEFGHQLKNGTLDAEKLVNFLNDWLIQHILGVDMKYSRFHLGSGKTRPARLAKTENVVRLRSPG